MTTPDLRPLPVKISTPSQTDPVVLITMTDAEGSSPPRGYVQTLKTKAPSPSRGGTRPKSSGKRRRKRRPSPAEGKEARPSPSPVEGTLTSSAADGAKEVALVGAPAAPVTTTADDTLESSMQSATPVGDLVASLVAGPARQDSSEAVLIPMLADTPTQSAVSVATDDGDGDGANGQAATWVDLAAGADTADRPTLPGGIGDGALLEMKPSSPPSTPPAPVEPSEPGHGLDADVSLSSDLGVGGGDEVAVELVFGDDSDSLLGDSVSDFSSGEVVLPY